MECVERFSKVSRNCCKVVAMDPCILSELLQYLRRCNRSRPHESTLNSLLGIMNNICRYPDLLPEVFKAEDCMEILSEKLQMFRDMLVRSLGVFKSFSTNCREVWLVRVDPLYSEA